MNSQLLGTKTLPGVFNVQPKICLFRIRKFGAPNKAHPCAIYGSSTLNSKRPSVNSRRTQSSPLHKKNGRCFATTTSGSETDTKAEQEDSQAEQPENVWQELLNRIIDQGIDGTGVSESAKSLAEEYASNTGYNTTEERVEALIRAESAKSFATGFLSGVGGLWTMAFAVPVAVYANWVLQARVAGAIACLYGHNLTSVKVRSLCLLCLLGDSAWSVLKTVGVRALEKATSKAILRIPSSAIISINKAVGTKLVVKYGQNGMIQLQRAVPLLGGMVSGGFDASACMLVGRVASKMFRPDGTMEEIQGLQLDWDGTIDIDDYEVL